MQLSDILTPTSVRYMNGLSSKKRLLQMLADLSNSEYNLDAQDVFTALQDRENLGSTGVGNGVAIPHARTNAVDKVIGFFVRLDTPLNYDSMDKQPVDLVFTLLAPPNEAAEHLRALALVSRTLRNEANCAKLRANDDAVTLYTILTDELSTKAA